MNYFSNLLIVLALSITNCQQSAVQVNNETQTAEKKEYPESKIKSLDKRIEKVDFENFTYDWYPS